MPSGNSFLIRPPLSALSSGRRRPTVAFAINVSSPTPPMRSVGSITLPSDLLIFLPSPSRTMPWMYTVLKGTSPVKWAVIMIIRATQKKMMS